MARRLQPADAAADSRPDSVSEHGVLVKVLKFSRQWVGLWRGKVDERRGTGNASGWTHGYFRRSASKPRSRLGQGEVGRLGKVSAPLVALDI